MMYDGNDYVILMDTQKSMVIYCLEIYKPKSKSPNPDPKVWKSLKIPQTQFFGLGLTQ